MTTKLLLFNKLHCSSITEQVITVQVIIVQVFTVQVFTVQVITDQVISVQNNYSRNCCTSNYCFSSYFTSNYCTSIYRTNNNCTRTFLLQLTAVQMILPSRRVHATARTKHCHPNSRESLPNKFLPQLPADDGAREKYNFLALLLNSFIYLVLWI